MHATLHKGSSTTPAIRCELCEWRPPVSRLAPRDGLSTLMVRNCRERTAGIDPFSYPYRLQTTSFRQKKATDVALVHTLLVAVNDTFVVTCEFIDWRVWHSVLNLYLSRDELSDVLAVSALEGGYRHGLHGTSTRLHRVGFPLPAEFRDEKARRYMFAATDPFTRRVSAQILPTTSLQALLLPKACTQGRRVKATTVTTYQRREFMHRFVRPRSEN